MVIKVPLSTNHKQTEVKYLDKINMPPRYRGIVFYKNSLSLYSTDFRKQIKYKCALFIGR